MKKIYKNLFFGVTAMLSFSASAQLVSNYSFTQTAGTYLAITGGTVFGNTANDDERFVNPANLGGGNANGGPGFPIGFDFIYNGVTYDRFGVNVNGWISLGQSTLTPNPVNLQIPAAQSDYDVISSTSTAPANLQCRIAGLSTDLEAQTGATLRAQTIGTTPNRTLVVQWSNYSEYLTSGQSLNFQVMLRETVNIVDVVYGTFTTGSAGSAQVGLRGQANTNFNNRRVTNTGSWATSIAGTANTQLCNFNATLTPASGTTFEWSQPIPCNGTPVASNAVPNTTLACLNSPVNVTLSAAYSASAGISFQWQSSATGIPGSYTSITNATLSALAVPNLTAITFYQAIVTCSSPVASSIISVPVTVNAIPSVTNNIPYLETFEGIISNNNLPNCQWSATNINNNTYTYLSSTGVFNQTNHTPGGSKFASFSFSSNDAFFSNGLLLQPGTTYSAAIWYITDGHTGWTNLSINVGTLQTIASLTNIATAAASTNTNYALLSGTFTIPSAGLYYMGVRCQSNASPDFLSWDDLSVTAPCTLNNANFSINAPTVVCSGDPTVITATTGVNTTNPADTYSWSTGAQTNTALVTPVIYTTYSVTGTSTAGCVGTKTVGININPLPTFSVFATPTAICPGGTVSQVAVGPLVSYTWSTGDNTPFIQQAPTATTTYTLFGTGINGCKNSAEQIIVVNTPPTVSAATTASIICRGKSAGLQATGNGDTYLWTTGPTSFISGQTINVTPTVTTVYTVTATDANGCINTATIEQKVDICQGINAVSGNSLAVQVYPNPNTGEFNIELLNGSLKNIYVMDVTGRIILSNTSSNEKINVDISKFAAGIYYVKIQSENKTEVVKVVKH